MLLKDKVAIVTGGSQGIGKGIARVFCENGAKVVICARNEAKALGAAEEIKSATGILPFVIAADVSKKPEVEAAVQKTVLKYGGIDILVNNAGIQRFKPFLEIEEADWDEHYDINVKGAFLFSQAAGRVMVKAGGGKIINIASDSGVAPIPDNAAAYCSSKSAMIGLTRNIAKELGRFGVYCNAICPGAVGNTGMMDYFMSYNKQGEQACIDASALRRIGTPGEIGNAALFFASELSGFITGEHILVTGGDIMSQ